MACSVRAYLAEQAIAQLPAACPHCAERLTRGDLPAHEASCSRAPNVGCAAAAEGCEWEGRVAARAAHEVRRCRFTR